MSLSEYWLCRTVFLRPDDLLLTTQPLNDKWAVLNRHAKPVHSEPADRDVNVKVIQRLSDLASIETARVRDRGLDHLSGGVGVRGVIGG